MILFLPLFIITLLILLKKRAAVYQFLHRLLHEHPNVTLALGPRPDEHSPYDERVDDLFWDAQKVIVEDEWKEVDPDIALRIRRPATDSRNGLARLKQIKGYSSIKDASWVDSYYLKLDAGLSVARRRVNGVWKALEEDVPLDGSNQHFLHRLKRDLHACAGFPSLLNPPV